MVNNTARNKQKIGKGAGINDGTRLTITSAVQTEKGLEARGKAERNVLGLMHAGEFLSIKAYLGGNPNKAKINDELVH